MGQGPSGSVLRTRDAVPCDWKPFLPCPGPCWRAAQIFAPVPHNTRHCIHFYIVMQWNTSETCCKVNVSVSVRCVVASRLNRTVLGSRVNLASSILPGGRQLPAEEQIRRAFGGDAVNEVQDRFLRCPFVPGRKRAGLSRSRYKPLRLRGSPAKSAAFQPSQWLGWSRGAAGSVPAGDGGELSGDAACESPPWPLIGVLDATSQCPFSRCSRYPTSTKRLVCCAL